MQIQKWSASSKAFAHTLVWPSEPIRHLHAIAMTHMTHAWPMRVANPDHAVLCFFGAQHFVLSIAAMCVHRRLFARRRSASTRDEHTRNTHGWFVFLAKLNICAVPAQSTEVDLSIQTAVWFSLCFSEHTFGGSTTVISADIAH